MRNRPVCTEYERQHAYVAGIPAGGGCHQQTGGGIQMRLAALVVFLLGSLTASAKPEYFEQIWQKGNSYYAQKQYDSAAVYFEKLAAENPGNAVVYYNLGNAYYRLNQVGPAV